MVLGEVAGLLAPPRCLACGARGASPWCSRCARAADARRLRRVCTRCAGAGGAHACWSPRAPVTATVASFAYGGVVAAAIVGAKVRGAWRAWPSLGAMLARDAHGVFAGVARPAAVTWVPPDPRRLRERGFDHAGLLAAAVASASRARLVETLRATRARTDQASLPTSLRRAVADDAFTPVRAISPVTMVLVDDVLTTGATVAAAARTLVSAGAAQVVVAVVARAGRHVLA